MVSSGNIAEAAWPGRLWQVLERQSTAGNAQILLQESKTQWNQFIPIHSSAFWSPVSHFHCASVVKHQYLVHTPPFPCKVFFLSYALIRGSPVTCERRPQLGLWHVPELKASVAALGWKKKKGKNVKKKKKKSSMWWCLSRAHFLAPLVFSPSRGMRVRLQF